MIIKGKYTDVKVFASLVDESALEQLRQLADQPFTENIKIRVMPDAHSGKGCVIGTTMNIVDKVVPNLVGVDIGCGMLCVSLNKDEIDLKAFDSFIYKNIPSGRDVFKDEQVFKTNIEDIKCMKHLKRKTTFYKSIGTLGGGNHFIEIDIDDEGNKYLIVHAGSRNLGKQVAEHYQEIAIEKLKKEIFDVESKIEKMINDYKKSNNTKEIQNKIKEIKNTDIKLNVPRDLCYLTGKDFEDYLFDIEIVQRYASENRKRIVDKLLGFLGKDLSKLDYFETVHNYINHEDMILRKGAVASYKNKRLLIPINMKDGCLICIGKSNEDYNYSAPHGAGRLISRSEAMKSVSIEDYIESMKGIYTTSVSEKTKDESCFAYKPIDAILSNIKETVEVVKIIKPIYNFKSSD